MIDIVTSLQDTWLTYCSVPRLLAYRTSIGYQFDTPLRRALLTVYWTAYHLSVIKLEAADFRRRFVYSSFNTLWPHRKL